MIESTADRVSLEILDKVDEMAAKFGSLHDLCKASSLSANTSYLIEDKLINADLGLRLYTIAGLAATDNRVPFVLRRGGRIVRFGDRGIIMRYKEYFQRFFLEHAKGYSEAGLARTLTNESGLSFSKPSVHNYLIGDSVPDVHRLEAIARFFHHVPEYLVDRATIHI